MTEPEDLEEDLFADLYDADDNAHHQVPTNAAPANVESAPASAAQPPAEYVAGENATGGSSIQTYEHDQRQTDYNGSYQHATGGTDVGHGGDASGTPVEPETRGTGIKEDGKMFIGGLNWETTDQSLKDYFSQFGEVQECTVMRDGATGRSRGFGFLTFRDPKTVNTVMVKEHYLDGKIVRTSLRSRASPQGTRYQGYQRNVCSYNSKIDPKRAIPRDEQEKTSKIFVGGVSQEATEQDFKQFFMQFGRVVDATLMIDKDTGRPRGFGFVTFDSEAAVEATLSGPLEILGKPIEVKKAQPRGNMRDEEDRRNRRGREGFRDSSQGDGSQQQQNPQGQGGMAAGLTPQMMAQYWQRMQQYFALMQQQMAMAAATQGQGAMGGMGMGGMNPAMMQQMQQMKQMQQMQMGGNQQQGGMNASSPSPGPGAMPNMPPNMMNPAMMQQMQQMQSQSQGGGASPMGGNMSPSSMTMGGNAMGASGASMGMGGNFTGTRGGPGYNAQEQLAFEQQKYEQQQARRAIENRGFSPYQQGGPTSWEGMYDEVPQPSIPTGPQGMSRAGSMGRGMTPNSNDRRSTSAQPSKGPTPQPQSAAPANAPTGPKNAGKPGANYRGGGRGGHRGFHPYARG
ncbi:hypothetical protein Plec18170_009411 [Paecilomyces lecythidis]